MDGFIILNVKLNNFSYFVFLEKDDNALIFIIHLNYKSNFFNYLYHKVTNFLHLKNWKFVFVANIPCFLEKDP